MFSKRITILLFVFSVLFFQCQKELNFQGIDPINTNPAPVTTHLQGNVYDENNQPAAGVTIKVGTKTAITNNDGYFRIMNAALDKVSSLVTAEMPGYFKTYRTFPATSGTNHIEFKLIKRNLAGTLDGITGGEVLLPNGAKVQLAANGMVNAATGAAYTGTVNVYAAYIDPTAADIGQTVPGSFMADNSNDSRVILASFGMMAVELSTPAGEKLQVKQGTTAKLTMPIPSSIQSSAPASIPLWYVDESTGIWKEEGNATKTGNAYVGDVKHFTFWNCDIYYPTIPLNFTLKNSAGFPIVHAYVQIRKASQPNQGMSHGYTDTLGQGNPFVAATETLVLTVFDPCGTVAYTQNIGPFAQATDLGSITITNSQNAAVTVKGTLKDCNGAPVTNGYAMLIYNNTPRYSALNASGQFIFSFVKCISGINTATLAGVDVTNNLQGNSQSITLSNTVTDIGDYQVCGTSTQQFVNYTLDGANFSLPVLSTDTMLAWTQPLQGTTLWESYVSAVSGPSSQFCSFKWNSASLVNGSYPLTLLIVNGKNAVTPVITVNITSFAQAALEFYEGNFSGSFNDVQGNPHTISSNFRIRRQF
jgi:hypothetical protein